MTTHPHLEGLIRKWRERARYHDAAAEQEGLSEAQQQWRNGMSEMAYDCANDLEALAALPGGGVEYQFEVWQDDGCQAYGSGDTLESIQPEAGHYALMYGQDGPVEVKYFERREIVTPTPNPHEADRNE